VRDIGRDNMMPNDTPQITPATPLHERVLRWMVELPYRWKRQTYPPVVDWTTESEAFTQALARALATEKAPL
jgi:hypothetical protein